MALTLRRVHAELDAIAGSASAQDFARQPGLAMMLDLLGARSHAVGQSAGVGVL